jgi:ATP-dependent RNA helicase RhlE
LKTFISLGLSAPILDALAEQGYDTPSPIQSKAIPAVLEGKDVMGAAQTGTGKTAGFTLPILQKLSNGKLARSNHVRALILTPTRELAAQVGNSVATYGKHLFLHSAIVFGGVKINPQMMKLRKGVDILVATPGRLLDLHSQNAVKFDQLEILVLDEADRMLDMGFIRDIKRIISLLPRQRQTLMFSATFSDNIRKLAKELVRNPVEISVSPRNTTVQSIDHWICPVDKSQKSALLTHLIKENNWRQVLVFTRTKHGANRLSRYLEGKGINSIAIHGNKSQAQRTKALAEFKNGTTPVLVATDIAARGLDINQLPHVVNFDLPNVPEDYIHRIGRTGRAGAGGEAISLVSADESNQLADIERLLKKLLPRTLVDGFEPDHDVPESRLDRRTPRPKKQRSGQVDNKSESGAGKSGEPRKHKPGNSKTKRFEWNKKKRLAGSGKSAPKTPRKALGKSTRHKPRTAGSISSSEKSTGRS